MAMKYYLNAAVFGWEIAEVTEKINSFLSFNQYNYFKFFLERMLDLLEL